MDPSQFAAVLCTENLGTNRRPQVVRYVPLDVLEKPMDASEPSAPLFCAVDLLSQPGAEAMTPEPVTDGETLRSSCARHWLV